MTLGQSLLYPPLNALKEQRPLIFKRKKAVKSGNYDRLFNIDNIQLNYI